MSALEVDHGSRNLILPLRPVAPSPQCDLGPCIAAAGTEAVVIKKLGATPPETTLMTAGLRDHVVTGPEEVALACSCVASSRYRLTTATVRDGCSPVRRAEGTVRVASITG